MNYLTPKQQKWRQVGPCITDFNYENITDWPVSACRWGPIIQETKQYIRQKIYFATRTDGRYDEATNSWKQTPCQLIVATIDIPQVGYSINHQVTYIFQQLQFYKNPHIKIKQMIVHPSEVNIIKCNPSNKLMATKNELSSVYVWDVTKHKTQQNPKDTHAAVPEVQLCGHTAGSSSIALDWSTDSRLASGGKDAKILLWDISDYQTRLSTSSIFTSKRELTSICGNDNIKLDKRITLSGHSSEVIGLAFCPQNQELLVSCCQDRQVICWDQRIEDGKAWSVLSAHKDDVHTIQWSKYDEHKIATGSNDGGVILIDTRMPDQQEVLREGYWVSSLQFGPDREHITVGSDELYTLNINTKETTFCYYGHKGAITDFDINEKSPWTYLSTCQEHEYGGGGCLHLWRLLDLIYLQEEAAIQRLSQ